jgi:hypothetical protein
MLNIINPQAGPKGKAQLRIVVTMEKASIAEAASVVGQLSAWLPEGATYDFNIARVPEPAPALGWPYARGDANVALLGAAQAGVQTGLMHRNVFHDAAGPHFAAAADIAAAGVAEQRAQGAADVQLSQTQTDAMDDTAGLEDNRRIRGDNTRTLPNSHGFDIRQDDTIPPAHEAKPSAGEPAAPAKRTRRTKAEMEAARAASDGTNGSDPSSSGSTSTTDGTQPSSDPIDGDPAAVAGDAPLDAGTTSAQTDDASSEATTSDDGGTSQDSASSTSEISGPTADEMRSQCVAAMKRSTSARAAFGALLAKYHAGSISDVPAGQRVKFLEEVALLK